MPKIAIVTLAVIFTAATPLVHAGSTRGARTAGKSSARRPSQTRRSKPARKSPRTNPLLLKKLLYGSQRTGKESFESEKISSTLRVKGQRKKTLPVKHYNDGTSVWYAEQGAAHLIKTLDPATPATVTVSATSEHGPDSPFDRNTRGYRVTQTARYSNGQLETNQVEGIWVRANLPRGTRVRVAGQTLVVDETDTRLGRGTVQIRETHVREPWRIQLNNGKDGFFDEIRTATRTLTVDP